jgi:hypothetical protein
MPYISISVPFLTHLFVTIATTIAMTIYTTPATVQPTINLMVDSDVGRLGQYVGDQSAGGRNVVRLPFTPQPTTACIDTQDHSFPTVSITNELNPGRSWSASCMLFALTHNCDCAAPDSKSKASKSMAGSTNDTLCIHMGGLTAHDSLPAALFTAANGKADCT